MGKATFRNLVGREGGPFVKYAPSEARGNTILRAAASFGNRPLVEQLVEANVQLNSRTSSPRRRSALDLAWASNTDLGHYLARVSGARSFYRHCSAPLPLHSTPLHSTHHSTPLHSTPLHSTPLHFTPLHSTPLRSTPLHSAPLHSTPLHSTSLHSAPLHSTPFHSL